MKRTKKCLVAFDFDGVIWDSVDECFYTAYAVFQRFEGEIDADGQHLLRQFKNGRCLAKDGDDFYILLHLIKQNPNIDFSKINFQEFESLRFELARKAANFVGPFYEERKNLQLTNFEFWASLQHPYPGVIEQLPAIKENFIDLVISSTKDTASIEQLLARHNQSYRVYGREVSLYKPDHMKRITEDFDIPFSNILFTDDLLENLLDVKTTGAVTFMATWGYNHEGEQVKAKKNHVRLLEKENLFEQLEQVCKHVHALPG